MKYGVVGAAILFAICKAHVKTAMWGLVKIRLPDGCLITAQPGRARHFDR